MDELIAITSKCDQARTDHATAQISLAAFTSERDRARASLVTAKAKLGTLTGERDLAKRALATAPTRIVCLTAARDKAMSNLTAVLSDVTAIEKLCGLHGVARADALRVTDSVQKVSMADFALKLKVAKTPEARAAICAEYEKAVKEKRLTD